MNIRIQKAKLLGRLVVFALMAWNFASCAMMETDRTDCPTGLYVKFVYDYNVQRADMFKDHVGGVTLYVFDESDRLVMQREVANVAGSAPLREYGFTMHFTEDELPAGRYRLLAVAQQKGYTATLQTDGAKFRRTTMAAGDARTAFGVTLDRQEADADGVCPVNHDAPLDTLWMGTLVNPAAGTAGADSEWVEVRDQRPAYATVYLVRDTKHISVTLQQMDEPTNISHEDYEVTITCANGRLGHDNAVLDDAPLRYTHYAARTAETADGLYHVAHYDLNSSRLMWHKDDRSKNARLRVYDKTRQTEILSVDLLDWLCAARITDEYRYSEQEYLDREYDYRLHIILKGTTWQEVQIIPIHVNVLAYAIRIQNVDL